LFMADIDPSSPATHNGTPLPTVVASKGQNLHSNTTILVDSKLFQTHYLRGFPGKCRCFGSTALHVCLVAQQSGFALSHSCSVHVWDIAAAHAIARRVGITVQYLDGRPLNYADLLSGRPTPEPIMAGPPGMLDAIRPLLVPRNP
jgi:fructose-1,6-bisphosphatase/inositol monophosphatase family enzyme